MSAPEKKKNNNYDYSEFSCEQKMCHTWTCDSVQLTRTRLNVAPVDIDVSIAIRTILFVQESAGMHELVNNSTDFGHATRCLKIDILERETG